MVMKDSFEIDGKIYISSRRAAEMSKYSNDYIGQLCRGGKVSARMIGRTWFVDQESLLEHKKTSEEAFQARCKTASREQQKSFATATASATATSGGAIVIPSYSENVLSGYTSHASNYASKISGNNLNHSTGSRRSLTAVLVTVILIVGIFLVEKNASVISSIDVSSQSGYVYSSIENVIQSVGSIVGTSFNDTLAWFENIFSRKPQYAVRIATPSTSIVSTASVETPWDGMAVVPSGVDNPNTKEKIQNSFSDVVKITPDQSGTAGVITPVFKKTTGTTSNDFMYVLVPVKEGKKDALGQKK